MLVKRADTDIRERFQGASNPGSAGGAEIGHLRIRILGAKLRSVSLNNGGLLIMASQGNIVFQNNTGWNLTIINPAMNNLIGFGEKRSGSKRTNS